MKKIMMAAVALICMTIVSISLTACGSDDDDKEMTCDYIVASIATNHAYSYKKDDANPWNKIVDETDVKVQAILEKYSNIWTVQTTSSNMQQVVTINDDKAKQMVAEMKAELNKVFADLKSLESEYPNDYIMYLIHSQAMNNFPVNGKKGWNTFIDETITLRFGPIIN
ncbi:MAG: hypothetical protein IJ902_00750 [Prevotella sp.]|nr:hypothetical protein [Prevotella sp.]